MIKKGDLVQLKPGAWDFCGDIYQPPGGLVRRYGLHYDKPYKVLSAKSTTVGRRHIVIENDDGIRCGGLSADRFEPYGD